MEQLIEIVHKRGRPPVRGGAKIWSESKTCRVPLPLWNEVAQLINEWKKDQLLKYYQNEAKK